MLGTSQDLGRTWTSLKRKKKVENKWLIQKKTNKNKPKQIKKQNKKQINQMILWYSNQI